MSNISLYLKETEDALAECLPELSAEADGLKDVIAYALSGGGKRIRPLLCLEFCAAAGGNPDNALPFACAVEFIHTYSLIHDDLPCMDNDDYRRGKFSSHKKFGEANALLAGDALLTHAFFLVADAAARGKVTPEQANEAVRELSSLCGMSGMVGGQYIDMKYENTAASIPVLIEMDTLKTSALIEAACVMGLIAAGADKEAVFAARRYARELGLAFQIVDDLLENGEPGTDSDIKNGKSTYAAAFGVEKARHLAASHTENALDALKCFGEKAEEIRKITKNLLDRKK